MMRNIDEIVREIGTELGIDPLKVKYMAKAYDIPQVREHFMHKYSSDIDGKNPITVFCKKCREDEEVRKEAYRWMSIVEDVGPSKLMISPVSKEFLCPS
jgi:hypothetical protein